MNIYIAHSQNFDFKVELYDSIKKSSLFKENVFVFPHEKEGEFLNSKEIIKNSCELVIAEVSYPSTGLGVELGWANAYNVPIICLYKEGCKISQSLKVLTNDFLEYSNKEDLIKKINNLSLKL